MSRLSSFSKNLLSVLCAIALSGCATTTVFPNTGLPSSAAALGTITGSDYGGHAPIVGAHVFVMQATASATGNGYGQAATSLLSASYTASNGYPTTQDLSGTAATNPTYGMYYVTTSYAGDFNITGDYTCTPGLPVYLYAPGGTSAILPNTAIASGTVTGSSATFTSNNLFSVGQWVTFGYFGNAAGVPLNTGVNGTSNAANGYALSYQVTAATLTSFTVSGAGAFAIQGSTGGGTAFPVLASNPAIANIAVLGNCSTATNFSSLKYVYLNEVSTVAAAYALGGFLTNSSTSLNSLDAVHLSVPLENGNDGTSAAWVGIENAANNAALLYDVQGGGQLSSAGDGEGHVANAATASGGTVPQALIDGIANALAACVDSGNTASTATTPCTTLLGAALATTSSGGTPTGTAPKDTATVAINLAHNPWTSQATTILNLGSGEVPYVPMVSSATDLSVAISYPISSGGTYAHNSVAIDAGGNAWVTAFDAGTLTKLSPVGAKQFTYTFPSDGIALETPGAVAIDSQGRAWVAIRNLDGALNQLLTTTKSNNVYDGAYLFASDGTPAAGNPFVQANASAAYDQLLTDNITVAIDGSDNVYFADHLFSNALVLNSVGAVTKSFGNPSTTASNSTYGGPFGVALDATGNLWMSSNIGAISNPIDNVTYWPTAASTSTQTATISNISNPEGLAIDASGDVWVANASASALYEIKSGATSATAYTNGGIKNAVDVVVDGAGLVFASSETGGAAGTGNLAVFNNSGTALSGSSGITGTYTASGSTVTSLSRPYFLAIDNSGDVWVSTNTSAVEYIGLATPVLTPLSAAVKKGTIASRP